MSVVRYQTAVADPRIGLYTAFAIGGILVAWQLAGAADAAGGGQARYILYALPLICIALQCLLQRFVVPLDLSRAQAFGLYAVAAGTAVLTSRESNPFVVRDVLIIGTYLMMFAVSWTASVRDVFIVTLACFACMAIEAIQEGLHFSVDVLTSDGILESVMAFPLGVIVLYAIGTRRLGFALLTALFFFAAYKRIALVAVVAVLAFEWVLAILGLARYRRIIAVMLVITLSLTSLFSLQLFEYAAKMIGGENVSANSISLGRFEFSVAIWRQIDAASVVKLLFGHGPGATDAIVQAAIDDASNPHNDWLKIFVDYGLFGFVLFHLIIIRLFSDGFLSVWLYIYTAIVMMTDNTLIYTFHYAIVLVVVRAAATGAAVGPSLSWWPTQKALSAHSMR